MARIVLDKSGYRVLGALIHQLRFSSPKTLNDQTFLAERLIQLIDAEKAYPYDFVCYKLTGYKPKEIPSTALLPGCDIIHDAVRFIKKVTEQNPQPFDLLPENYFPVNELSEENSISTKTFKRWARLGLSHRIIIGPSGFKISVILKSTWNWFVERHEKLVARAAAFSRLTHYQRQSIIHQAKRLIETRNLSRNQIELVLSEKTGRARETIRYILTNYDKHSDTEFRLFPSRVPMTEELRREIFEMFARGIPIDQLARIHSRSRPTIYRIVNEERERVWKSKPIEFIVSPEFELPSADDSILSGYNVELQIPADGVHPSPLKSEQEMILFRAYNYLKWKQDKLIAPYRNESSVPSGVLDKIENLQGKIDTLKNKLILANQALVVSIAKKHLNGAMTLDELVSDGLIPLIKAIEKFDYTRGFKFSTYASWAIMKHFARAVPAANEELRHVLSDEDISRLLPGVDDVDEGESFKRSKAVQDALEQLDDRERHILEIRYGLNRDEDALSLSELGKQLGVSKERIRQIESKAMEKVHGILKDTLTMSE
jgi:RNA polymerase sigma factor (sigma-70 family)